jgi:ATP-dependent exoDNAse (exonuclease V) alpha subunit
MNLIFVGDFAQLPPVMDKPMWQQSFQEKSNFGYLLFKTQFNKHIRLSKIKRQEDERFKSLLNNIRDGKITKKDFEMLKTRLDVLNKKPDDYDDIIRLFSTNEPVHKYNFEKLKTLQKKGKPVAKIVSSNVGKGASNLPPDKFRIPMLPVLYLAQGARVMLRGNLLPARFGLVNGSIGTVVDIVYEQGKKPDDFPDVVVVDFPQYKGPVIFKDHPTYVPIPPMESRCAEKEHLRRTQIPLWLCWSMTIHKSQGETMHRAVIDIGKRELAAGLTYVAISRLRTFEGLFLTGTFNWPRLQTINKRKEVQKRIIADEKLMGIYKNTVANLDD